MVSILGLVDKRLRLPAFSQGNWINNGFNPWFSG